MNNAPTPETDAVRWTTAHYATNNYVEVVEADFARKLECERDEARATLAEVRQCSIDKGEAQQIQLDAMKEGMRRAAEIAEGETFAVGGIRTDLEVAYDQGCNDCEKAILTAAEQLTEKDL